MYFSDQTKKNPIKSILHYGLTTQIHTRILYKSERVTIFYKMLRLTAGLLPIHLDRVTISCFKNIEIGKD